MDEVVESIGIELALQTTTIYTKTLSFFVSILFIMNEWMREILTKKARDALRVILNSLETK